MSLILPNKEVPIASRLVFSVSVLFFLLICGCQETEPGPRGQSNSTLPSELQWVTLTIKHETTLEFDPIQWHEEMTVFDVLSQAHSRDSVDFEHRGSGERILVTAIDGVAGGGGGEKNWIYSVNGQQGVRSCGISLVEPGDSILWEYTEY